MNHLRPHPCAVHLVPANSPGAHHQAALLSAEDDPCSSIVSVSIAGRRVSDCQPGLVESDTPRASSRLRFRGVFDIAGLRRLAAVLRDAQPDVVHLWDPQFLPTAALAAVSWRRTWSLVATYRHGVQTSAGSPFSRRMFHHFDRVIADCEAIANQLRHGQLKGVRVSTIAGGAPKTVERDSSARNSRSNVVARSNAPQRDDVSRDDTPRDVVALGPLSRHKRLDDLIWAVDILAPLEPRLRLVVVGDGPVKWDLRQMSQSVRRGSRIVFASNAKRITALKTAEMFALPGNADGCSSGLLQAMSLGVPVIAAAGGGNSELITDRASGLSFSKGDRAGLAACIWRLLNHPDLQRRLEDTARRKVEQDFAAERMASAYTDLYRELLTPGGSGDSRQSQTGPHRHARSGRRNLVAG